MRPIHGFYESVFYEDQKPWISQVRSRQNCLIQIKVYPLDTRLLIK